MSLIFSKALRSGHWSLRRPEYTQYTSETAEKSQTKTVEEPKKPTEPEKRSLWQRLLDD